MKATVLLNYDENTHQVEEEEKSRFLRSVLEQMGVPIDDFWTNDEALSVAQRMKLRSILNTFNIQVLDDNDGFLQIYFDNELVGEWNKCTYKLKRDLGQINPKKQLYLEMLVDCWTIFEEQETLET